MRISLLSKDDCPISFIHFLKNFKERINYLQTKLFAIFVDSEIKNVTTFEYIVKRKGKLMFTLTVLANIGLVVTLLTPYISPAKFWPVELFGLAYPIIYIVNLFFIVYWALLKRKRVFITLVLVLLSYRDIRSYIQFNLMKEKPPVANGIKVISYNARLFDLYNWTKQKSTRTDVFSMLRKEEPEILCLQEFYTSGKKNLNNLDSLKNIRKGSYYHVEYSSTLGNSDKWGIITLSAYPIINKGKVLFNEKTNNLCIYSDIKIQEDTVRVFNVHFQSNRLQKEDYEFIGDPYSKKDEDKIKASKNILRRIKIGVIKRARQVDTVTHYIQNSPFPVIVCGDFNDTPCSYTYHQLSDHLKDTFIESGNGIGNTYNGSLPPLRIDYILHSDHFSTYSYEVIKRPLSDHYPVVSEIGFAHE